MDAESREQCILRQRLGDDGAPQKRACRAAYIPAHYIITAATWSTAADVEGRERAVLCGCEGVGCVGGGEGSNQTSRHYASAAGLQSYGECASTEPACTTASPHQIFPLIDSPAEFHHHHCDNCHCQRHANTHTAPTRQKHIKCLLQQPSSAAPRNLRKMSPKTSLWTPALSRCPTTTTTQN